MPVVAFLYLLLAVFDAWYTSKRIPQLGIEAEFNPFIKWLSYKYGIVTGIYVGVLAPTVVILTFALYLPMILIYLLGARTTLFAFQMKVFLHSRDSRTKEIS